MRRIKVVVLLVIDFFIVGNVNAQLVCSGTVE